MPKKGNKDEIWYYRRDIQIAIISLFVTVIFGILSLFQIPILPRNVDFDAVVRIKSVNNITIYSGSLYQSEWKPNLTLTLLAIVPHDSVLSINTTEFIPDHDLKNKLIDVPWSPHVDIDVPLYTILENDKSYDNLKLDVPLSIKIWLNPKSIVLEKEIKIGELMFIVNIYDTISKKLIQLNSSVIIIWRNNRD